MRSAAAHQPTAVRRQDDCRHLPGTLADRTVFQSPQAAKIKTFVGTSANAVRIQIWTALITILLLKILQFKSTFGWASSNLVALLRWNLFSYRDLWEWINRPFDTPPESLTIQGEFFDLDSSFGSRT